MKYTPLAYNNAAHSVTKLKSIGIIKGQVTDETPREIDINKFLATTYNNKFIQKIIAEVK